MLFDRVIAFDNKENKIILIANLLTKELEKSYQIASKQIEIMKDVIENGEPFKAQAPILKSDFKPLFDGEQYAKIGEKGKALYSRG